MVEPGPIVGSLQLVAKLAARFAKSDEVDRLFKLLDQRFGATTGLTLTQLDGVWRQDPAFQRALWAISQDADWATHRPELRAAIVDLTATDAQKPTDDESELLDEVVASIEELLPAAKEGADSTRYEGRLTRIAVSEQNVRYVSLDWAPDRAKDLVRELIEHRPEEGAKLEDSLKGEDPGQVIRGLIGSPPAWVTKGSGWLWAALATIAEQAGEWHRAQAAWRVAADSAGGDRIVALWRAGIAAAVVGDEAASEDLLAQARKAGPEHAVVLINQAQLEEDPRRRPEVLARAVPATARQTAALEAEYVLAYAELEEFDQADAHLARAKDAGVDFGRVREVAATLVVAKHRQAWSRGNRVDRAALESAAEQLLELRDEHRALRVPAVSVRFTAQVADAYLKAGRSDKAAELLSPENLLQEELAVPSGPEQLAELANKAQRPDLALELLPDAPTDEVGRLLRAMALLELEKPEGLTEATALLDEIVENGELQSAAALPRLVASAYHDQPWSEAAEAGLKDDEPVITAALKAKWYTRSESWDAAERELAQFQDQPRAQHQLLQVAIQQGDVRKVRLRAKELLGGDIDGEVRYDASTALLRIGDVDEAERQLATLKDDPDEAQPLRIRAAVELTRLALEADRHSDVVELTEELLKWTPDDKRVAWTLVNSLFRLGRHGDAGSLIHTRVLQPESIQEARLAAHLFSLTLPPSEALERIVEIANGRANPDETLEAIAFQTLVRVKEGLPSELAERVGPEHFLKLFPESDLIKAVPFPQTAEGLDEFLEQFGSAARAKHSAEFHRQVFQDGDTPTAMLAYVAGKGLGELWGRLPGLPLSYGDSMLDELERADAAAAIGIGAVLDPTSLYVAGGLGSEFMDLARQALQRTVITQGTLDDSVVNAVDPAAQEEERREMGMDIHGRPWVDEWSPVRVERERARAAGMLALARQQRIEPDAPGDDVSPEAELLRESDLPLPVQAYAGTLIVAKRLDMAVFSDDRFVRVRARRLGMPAFGTLALIDALEAKRYLDSEARSRLRRRLRSSGALGTQPSLAELVGEAEANGWRLTKSLATALQDPTPVISDTATGVRTLVAFLRACFQSGSDSFGDWTLRILDALQSAVPRLAYEVHAQNLVLVAWPLDDDSDDGAFFRALIEALRRRGPELGHIGDPVIRAAGLMARGLSDEAVEPTVKVLVARQLLEHLSPSDRRRARSLIFGG